MLRLFTFLALTGFCLATTIKWPSSGDKTCILIDIDVNNTISWKNSTGKTESENWDFSDSTTISGNCDADTPRVTRHWDSDGGTYTFSFSKKDGKAFLDMSLTVVPDNVFKNGDKDAVILDLETMALGDDTKAFMCDALPDMKATKAGKSGDTYSMTIRIKSIHVQAFNLKDGQFGEDDVCQQDTTTTVKPDTTEPPVTTEPTTVKPNTTEPPVTTEPTTHVTNATTPAPSNHSTPEPAPKPSSKHPTKTVHFFDKSVNVTCVNIKGQFLFTLPYPKADKTNGSVTIGLDDIVNTLGSCNDSAFMNTLMIEFYNNWWMNLTFMRDDSKMLGASAKTKYWWHELDLSYTLDDDTFPDRDPTVSSMNLTKTFDKDFNQATVEGSYLCNSNIKTDLGGGAELQTWDLQYNAFQGGNKTSFDDDNVAECKEDAKTNSIVPIAVGAALAGLVVIVLIAYLIGRRRNRKGYESV